MSTKKRLNGDLSKHKHKKSRHDKAHATPAAASPSLDVTLSSLISPVTTTEFLASYWEKKLLLCRAKDRGEVPFKWLTCDDLWRLCDGGEVFFTQNLDVTNYVDGKRVTLNPAGRAHSKVAQDFYQKGCSLRLLNPQTFLPVVWRHLASLQRDFGCACGANVYLTPAGSQGFAPHYDDIEAFVIQLEGKKRWRVYAPVTGEELPRFSSPNLPQDQLSPPLLDTVLSPGDVLYFPRGFIHQAVSLKDEHSLHITVSTYQKWTLGDVLERALPAALTGAIEQEVSLRAGLPLRFSTFMGRQHAENEAVAGKRAAFRKSCQAALDRVLDHLELELDGACEELLERNLHDSLPPSFTAEEERYSVLGKCVPTWKSTSMVRLLTDQVMLTTTDDGIQLVTSAYNARVYHGRELEPLSIADEAVEQFEILLHAYPNLVTIQQLSDEETECDMTFIRTLYDAGLLLVKPPSD